MGRTCRTCQHWQGKFMSEFSINEGKCTHVLAVAVPVIEINGWGGSVTVKALEVPDTFSCSEWQSRRQKL